MTTDDPRVFIPERALRRRKGQLRSTCARSGNSQPIYDRDQSPSKAINTLTGFHM
jgi:hypothetical protein